MSTPASPPRSSSPSRPVRAIGVCLGTIVAVMCPVRRTSVPIAAIAASISSPSGSLPKPMATLVHECAHASGAKHRLDRNFAERFKRHSLAIKEATAELTASDILADLGIAHHPRPDHAAYVASWLRVLKDDPRAIFTAASKAQQAADWMHAQQPGADEQLAA